MERTILTGALVLDGSGGPPVPGRAVVVEQGRITAVVSATEAPSGGWTKLTAGGTMS